MCGKCMVMERNEFSYSGAPRPHADALKIREERLRQRRLQQQPSVFIPGVSDTAFCGVVVKEEEEEEVVSEINQPVHRLLSSIVQCDYCYRSFIQEKIFVHHRLCTLESPLNPIDLTPLGKRDKKSNNSSKIESETNGSDSGSYGASIKSTSVKITDSLLLLESFQQTNDKTTAMTANITDLS